MCSNKKMTKPLILCSVVFQFNPIIDYSLFYCSKLTPLFPVPSLFHCSSSTPVSLFYCFQIKPSYFLFLSVSFNHNIRVLVPCSDFTTLNNFLIDEDALFELIFYHVPIIIFPWPVNWDSCHSCCNSCYSFLIF